MRTPSCARAAVYHAGRAGAGAPLWCVGFGPMAAAAVARPYGAAAVRHPYGAAAVARPAGACVWRAGVRVCR